LDFLGNGELFQVFNGRCHDSTDRMDAFAEQTFMRGAEFLNKFRGRGGDIGATARIREKIF
jgi:hypothetical protein